MTVNLNNLSLKTFSVNLDIKLFAPLTVKKESRRRNQRLPDLIILDVVMPRMNGFETCRIIKATSELAKSDEYWGRKQGADEYMTKPFNSGELLKVIFRYLSRHLLLRYEREERRQKSKCNQNAPVAVKNWLRFENAVL